MTRIVALLCASVAVTLVRSETVLHRRAFCRAQPTRCQVFDERDSLGLVKQACTAIVEAFGAGAGRAAPWTGVTVTPVALKLIVRWARIAPVCFAMMAMADGGAPADFVESSRVEAFDSGQCSLDATNGRCTPEAIGALPLNLIGLRTTCAWGAFPNDCFSWKRLRRPGAIAKCDAIHHFWASTKHFPWSDHRQYHPVVAQYCHHSHNFRPCDLPELRPGSIITKACRYGGESGRYYDLNDVDIEDEGAHDEYDDDVLPTQGLPNQDVPGAYIITLGKGVGLDTTCDSAGSDAGSDDDALVGTQDARVISMLVGAGELALRIAATIVDVSMDATTCTRLTVARSVAAAVAAHPLIGITASDFVTKCVNLAAVLTLDGFGSPLTAQLALGTNDKSTNGERTFTHRLNLNPDHHQRSGVGNVVDMVYAGELVLIFDTNKELIAMPRALGANLVEHGIPTKYLAVEVIPPLPRVGIFNPDLDRASHPALGDAGTCSCCGSTSGSTHMSEVNAEVTLCRRCFVVSK